jgi:hypothetical protein
MVATNMKGRPRSRSPTSESNNDSDLSEYLTTTTTNTNTNTTTTSSSSSSSSSRMKKQKSKEKDKYKDLKIHKHHHSPKIKLQKSSKSKVSSSSSPSSSPRRKSKSSHDAKIIKSIRNRRNSQGTQNMLTTLENQSASSFSSSYPSSFFSSFPSASPKSSSSGLDALLELAAVAQATMHVSPDESVDSMEQRMKEATMLHMIGSVDSHTQGMMLQDHSSSSHSTASSASALTTSLSLLTNSMPTIPQSSVPLFNNNLSSVHTVNTHHNHNTLPIPIKEEPMQISDHAQHALPQQHHPTQQFVTVGGSQHPNLLGIILNGSRSRGMRHVHIAYGIYCQQQYQTNCGNGGILNLDPTELATRLREQQHQQQPSSKMTMSVPTNTLHPSPAVPTSASYVGYPITATQMSVQPTQFTYFPQQPQPHQQLPQQQQQQPQSFYAVNSNGGPSQLSLFSPNFVRFTPQDAPTPLLHSTNNDQLRVARNSILPTSIVSAV